MIEHQKERSRRLAQDAFSDFETLRSFYSLLASQPGVAQAFALDPLKLLTTKLSLHSSGFTQLIPHFAITQPTFPLWTKELCFSLNLNKKKTKPFANQ